MNPTESLERVERALSTAVDLNAGEVKYDEDTSVLRVEGGLEILEPLKRNIARRGVDHNFRAALLRNLRGSEVLRIELHKQAAYAGVASLVDSSDESPLGSITIVVYADNREDLRKVVDWLTS